jgi:hypothetical protein
VTRLLKLSATAALVLIATLGLAATAGARDRNDDRIPDRWEKRHGLSLKVNQARRDQDHDGLKNRGEFRARTDPRSADSDDDGTDDGDEQAGTVKAFDGQTLTIALFAGGEVSGRVTEDSEIECKTPGECERENGDRDDDEDEEERGDDDDELEDDGDRARSAGDRDECSPDALKVGAVVREAELDVSSDGAIWTEVELVED